jgi:hypothetical protein
MSTPINYTRYFSSEAELVQFVRKLQAAGIVLGIKNSKHGKVLQIR